MYNLIEKKMQAITFLPNQAQIQPSFVKDVETLRVFRESIAEHKKATQDRIEVLKYNVEAYQKDIANIQALKNTLTDEFEKLIARMHKAFEASSELLMQYVDRPSLRLQPCEPRALVHLQEDLRGDEEQLKDQELRLKILINNEKEINKLYGND
mgnify:CR=1 FL=1